MLAQLLIASFGSLLVGAGAVMAALAQFRKPPAVSSEKAAEAVNETAEIAAKLAASQEQLTLALLEQLRAQDARVDSLIDELRRERAEEPPPARRARTRRPKEAS